MRNILLLWWALCPLVLLAQRTITGTFPNYAGQEVKLDGFEGLKTYGIAKAKISEQGQFTLSYQPKDLGVGYLKIGQSKPLFVILTEEAIHIQGEWLEATETIEITQGFENQKFAQYALEQPRREQALSAWGYLERIYTLDTLFAQHSQPVQAIAQEKQRIKEEGLAFVNALPAQSYVRWFLPMRKLVSSVSTIAQYRTDEIPETLASFRSLDYTDPRLFKSGLFKDAIESHFWLLENCGKPLDSVFLEMQVSIDSMFVHLIYNEPVLNIVTDYLFDLLERHSLFKASEYLALKVLNEVSCTIDGDLAKQLETYRAMKKGNIAPDIALKGKVFKGKAEKAPQRLSDLQSDYVLVVFAASWCPKCREEVPQIAQLYDKWKAQGVEVLMVSLDEKEEDFKAFAGELPFASVCDFKKWESPLADAFYVFGTPTQYLLDRKREILLRPNSVKQTDAWVDWFLIQGNLKK
jgi:thiol-disulfide isomerase/thioredoxin